MSDSVGFLAIGPCRFIPFRLLAGGLRFRIVQPGIELPYLKGQLVLGMYPSKGIS